MHIVPYGARRAASIHRRGAQEEHDEEQPAAARHRIRGHHLRLDQPVQDHPIQVAAVQISTYLHTYLLKDVSTTISIYRRRHNQSYFLSYRQNIATIDQTIYYAYLKVSINIEIYLNDIHYYCV